MSFPASGEVSSSRKPRRARQRTRLEPAVGHKFALPLVGNDANGSSGEKKSRTAQSRRRRTTTRTNELLPHLRLTTKQEQNGHVLIPHDLRKTMTQDEFRKYDRVKICVELPCNLLFMEPVVVPQHNSKPRITWKLCMEATWHYWDLADPVIRGNLAKGVYKNALVVQGNPEDVTSKTLAEEPADVACDSAASSHHSAPTSRSRKRSSDSKSSAATTTTTTSTTLSSMSRELPMQVVRFDSVDPFWFANCYGPDENCREIDIKWIFPSLASAIHAAHWNPEHVFLQHTMEDGEVATPLLDALRAGLSAKWLFVNPILPRQYTSQERNWMTLMIMSQPSLFQTFYGGPNVADPKFRDHMSDAQSLHVLMQRLRDMRRRRTSSTVRYSEMARHRRRQDHRLNTSSKHAASRRREPEDDTIRRHKPRSKHRELDRLLKAIHSEEEDDDDDDADDRSHRRRTSTGNASESEESQDSRSEENDDDDAMLSSSSHRTGMKQEMCHLFRTDKVHHYTEAELEQMREFGVALTFSSERYNSTSIPSSNSRFLNMYYRKQYGDCGGAEISAKRTGRGVTFERMEDSKNSKSVSEPRAEGASREIVMDPNGWTLADTITRKTIQEFDSVREQMGISEAVALGMTADEKRQHLETFEEQEAQRLQQQADEAALASILQIESDESGGEHQDAVLHDVDENGCFRQDTKHHHTVHPVETLVAKGSKAIPLFVPRNQLPVHHTPVGVVSSSTSTSSALPLVPDSAEKPVAQHLQPWKRSAKEFNEAFPERVQTHGHHDWKRVHLSDTFVNSRELNKRVHVTPTHSSPLSTTRIADASLEEGGKHASTTTSYASPSYLSSLSSSPVSSTAAITSSTSTEVLSEDQLVSLRDSLERFEDMLQGKAAPQSSASASTSTSSLSSRWIDAPSSALPTEMADRKIPLFVPRQAAIKLMTDVTTRRFSTEPFAHSVLPSLADAESAPGSASNGLVSSSSSHTVPPSTNMLSIEREARASQFTHRRGGGAAVGRDPRRPMIGSGVYSSRPMTTQESTMTATAVLPATPAVSTSTPTPTYATTTFTNSRDDRIINRTKMAVYDAFSSDARDRVLDSSSTSATGPSSVVAKTASSAEQMDEEILKFVQQDPKRWKAPVVYDKWVNTSHIPATTINRLKRSRTNAAIDGSTGTSVPPSNAASMAVTPLVSAATSRGTSAADASTYSAVTL